MKGLPGFDAFIRNTKYVGKPKKYLPGIEERSFSDLLPPETHRWSDPSAVYSRSCAPASPRATPALNTRARKRKVQDEIRQHVGELF